MKLLNILIICIGCLFQLISSAQTQKLIRTQTLNETETVTETSKENQNLICDSSNSENGNKVCAEMQHIRSQILILGAQRDLMQINFPYLRQVALEMNGSTSRLKNLISTINDNHKLHLQEIDSSASELVKLTEMQSADSLRVSNNLVTNCTGCHNSINLKSEKKWSDVIKDDWSVFYLKCNEADRNPYICKNMHGMLSSVSSFITSLALKLENYEAIQFGAAEIYRIAKDLNDKNFLHGGRIALSMIEVKASELMGLAANKHPDTFKKAEEITQVCMQCHTNGPGSKPPTTNGLNYKFKISYKNK